MPEDPRANQPGLGCLVALSSALAVGGYTIVLALAYLIADPAPQRVPLGLPHASHLEGALYVVGFFVALPLGLVVGRRQADRIATGPNGPLLPTLCALIVGALGLAVLAARLVPGAGLVSTLAFAAIWCAATAGALDRARRAPEWRALARLGAHELAPAVGAATILIASLLAFSSPGSIGLVPLLITAAAAAFALAAYRGGWAAGMLPLPSGGRVGIDAGIVVLVLLAVPDLVVFGSPGATSAATAQVSNGTGGVIAFHHDLFLGPVNQLLAGDGVPVKTVGQYGVAPLYLLAGWFKLVPIGYGTFGFLDGVLTALVFACAYAVLRILRTPRLLAAAAMFVSVVVLAYNHPWSVGVFPQQGPLRFGLPMLILLAAAAEWRWPSRSAAASWARLAVIGLASIWSLESFLYCAVTLGALWAFEALTDSDRGGHWLRRQLLLALGACVAVHAAFALTIVLAYGELPNWGLYGDLVREFLSGGMSKVTFDIPAWSPIVAIGGAYATSVAGVAFAARRRSLLERERGPLATIAATTAFGVITLYYYVDRSLSSVLPYISLPLLMVGVLWLALVLRNGDVSLRLRTASLGFALGLAALLLATAWSSADVRFQRSALGHVIPGGESVGTAVSALWHPRPVDPRSPEAERLLDRYMPGEQRVYVLLPQDLATEALMTTGRANAFPFSDPWEEAIVASDRIGALRESVRSMNAGDRVLVWRPALSTPPGSPDAAIDNEIDTPLESAAGENGLLPLQVAALQLLRERFSLKLVGDGTADFVVVELAPKH